MQTRSLARRTWRLAAVGLVQLLILSAPTLASAQEVLLKWKYEEGSQLVYRVVTQQEIQLPMGMGLQVINQTETSRWTVQSVTADGDATITVTTEHARMEANGPSGSQVYDSDTDDAPTTPEARLAAGMLGLSYTMVVGADGTVKSVEDTEQLIETMRSSMPPEVIGLLGEMLNEDFFNNMAQQRTQGFPTEPLGINDGWEDSSSMTVPMLGTATRKFIFVLEGLEQRDGRTVALISSTGEMVLGDAAGGLLAGLMEIADTEITGSMAFDVDRGVILSSTTGSNMAITMSVGAQSMTMSVTMLTSQELIEYIPGA